MSKPVTTQSLRQTLLEAIDDIRSGRLEPKQAKAIADLADRVIETADLELRFAVTCSDLDAREEGVSPGPMLLADRREPGSE